MGDAKRRAGVDPHFGKSIPAPLKGALLSEMAATVVVDDCFGRAMCPACGKPFSSMSSTAVDRMQQQMDLTLCQLARLVYEGREYGNHGPIRNALIEAVSAMGPFHVNKWDITQFPGEIRAHLPERVYDRPGGGDVDR